MLKNRLVFGSIMIVILIGIVLLDARLDGSMSKDLPNKPVQGTLLMVLICLMAIPTQWEMALFARQIGAHIFKPITIPASIALATSFYWPIFANHPAKFFTNYLLSSITAIVLILFLVQAVFIGTKGTIRNCGASILSIFYLGFLGSFILGIRIVHGPWLFLMFIFTVKAADVGAYFIGKQFGKRKLVPHISPGKTWEGLIGGFILSCITAYVFHAVFDIMSVKRALLFGALFAILGQLGDLAESMLKRDAARKDSSDAVPGFGGILDVIDSPLATAPLAYAFFMWMNT